jgi:hypothetical protein
MHCELRDRCKGADRPEEVLPIASSNQNVTRNSRIEAGTTRRRHASLSLQVQTEGRIVFVYKYDKQVDNFFPVFLSGTHPACSKEVKVAEAPCDCSKLKAQNRELDQRASESRKRAIRRPNDEHEREATLARDRRAFATIGKLEPIPRGRLQHLSQKWNAGRLFRLSQ